MDVEFVTGTDTEDAFVEWCARRRRETVPPRIALAAAAVFAFIDLKLLWHRAEGTSVAFLVASAFQLAAAVIAVRAYDGERERPLRAPHAEVSVLGLFALSLVVSFAHRPSLLALMLLALTLTTASVVVACCWHSLGLVRRFAASHGRAQHVHIGPDGIDVTIRPEPRVRHISWRAVRYLGADGRALFIVAGVMPVVVPKRAFRSDRDWEEFVALSARYAGEALTSGRRKPIKRHAHSPKAR